MNRVRVWLARWLLTFLAWDCGDGGRCDHMWEDQ